MFIAQRLKQTSMAEYLLYMWQVEDIIRAYGLDMDRIEKEYLTKFGITDADMMKDMREWYGNLTEMMRSEGRTEKGHLQINQNTLARMIEVHAALLGPDEDGEYSAAYYKALPVIVELRQKGGRDKHEVENCLEALYGIMMLKLKGEQVSEATARAAAVVAEMLRLLSRKCLIVE